MGKGRKDKLFYTVIIDGTKYKELDQKISDIVVESVIDGADRFAMTLNYEFSHKKDKFKKFSPGSFKAGKKVTIKVGWEKRSNEQKLFVGKIQNMEMTFANEQDHSMGISGYGLLHDMMRGTPDDSWTKPEGGSKVKLKAPVSKKLGSYFGKKEIKSASKPKFNKIVQHDESDYLFIKRLADKYGYQFYTERDKVLFIPRKDLGSKGPVETLNFHNFEHISGEIDEADEIKKVHVRSWDMSNEKEIVGKAKKDKAKNSKKKVYRIPCESKSEADDIAKHKLNTLSKVKAHIHAETSRGKPSIKPGETVKLKDVGKKFGKKKYYITEATHRISSSGYTTSFEGSEVV